MLRSRQGRQTSDLLAKFAMLPPHRKTPDVLIMSEIVEHGTIGSTQHLEACDSALRPQTECQSSLYQPGVEACVHFDLVIIGAGPAALAVVSRILESRPAALYTEDEHRHLHFTHRKRAPPLIPSRINKSAASPTNPGLETQMKQGRKRRFREVQPIQGDDGCSCDGRIKILVVDKFGEGFMGLWRRNFKALGISHLRSPMFFHPDASDFDSLIAFANQRGRAAEGTPEQVIDLIEQRIAAKTFFKTHRGRSAKRRSRTGRNPSPKTADMADTVKGQRSNDCTLPDLIEILGVVGKEKSKHKRKQSTAAATSNKVHVNERDRRDYFTPSSALFDDFTRALQQKYRVQPCDDCRPHTWPKVSQFFDASNDDKPTGASSVPQEGIHALDESPVTTLRGRILDLAWFDGAERTIQDDFGNHHPGFLLSLDDGSAAETAEATVISSKAVVSAVGFGGMPAIPPYVSSPSESSPPACGAGWMHSSCLASSRFPAPPTVARPTTMVVVGGGLTSAQLVVRALEQGFDKVVLLVRGHLKSKPFDVDLGWVGRYSNYLKMQFWQNDDVHERLSTLRAARNGGSVTPTYAKVLARLQALGKLEIKSHTVIGEAKYRSVAVLDQADTMAAAAREIGSCEKLVEEKGMEQDEENVDEGGDKQWSLALRCNSDHGEDAVSKIRCDYLMLATGAKSDFSLLPFLDTLQRTHAIRLAGGMPVLTADLEYRRDVPLFVTGAYAGLQIGPAAGNLGGMRDSADRIANRLLELLALPQPAGHASEEAKRVHRQHVERTDSASVMTHFNFDLLSIEA